MALLSKLTLAFAIASLVALTRARELPSSTEEYSLEVRLAAGLGAATGGNGGGLVDCWNALLELKSCTDEIILFFLNGESYLGLDCCRAIRMITRQCWPAMLTSLGFTVQESDILRGYCDAETDAAPPGPAIYLPPHHPAAPPTRICGHATGGLVP